MQVVKNQHTPQKYQQMIHPSQSCSSDMKRTNKDGSSHPAPLEYVFLLSHPQSGLP